MPKPKYLADCDVGVCDWSRMTDNPNTAAVVMVCHAVLRHPEEYQEKTGKDPAQAEFDYREYIEAYRRYL